MTEVTHDQLLGERLQLTQLPRGHRVGTDAVLLAAMTADINATDIVDVGAATGAIGLMLGLKNTKAHLVFIEQDKQLAELCLKNVSQNGFSERAEVINADIFDKNSLKALGIKAGIADLVVTNPPFVEEGEVRLSPDIAKQKAHALPKGGLDLWIKAAAYLLRAKGTMALIQRADKLLECLEAFPKDFGAFRIRMIHPREGEAAVRVVIRAIKGRKSPTIIEAPLYLHGSDGKFTLEAEVMHRGDWSAQ
ncbi:methyltransferase [Microvirga sp. W0021]|uniref:Methyltransferase n=1 Tax=Hohaiivirga grylli TaxID=3133970 RepID=A0ABV0BHE9_9HYPH